MIALLYPLLYTGVALWLLTDLGNRLCRGIFSLSGDDVATVTWAHAVSIYSIYKVRAAAVDLDRRDGPGR